MVNKEKFKILLRVYKEGSITGDEFYTLLQEYRVPYYIPYYNTYTPEDIIDEDFTITCNTTEQ